jgi:hypothetical protein
MPQASPNESEENQQSKTCDPAENGHISTVQTVTTGLAAKKASTNTDILTL